MNSLPPLLTGLQKRLGKSELSANIRTKKKSGSASASHGLNALADLKSVFIIQITPTPLSFSLQRSEMFIETNKTNHRAPSET
jgi:hypothetical protein